MLFLCLLAAGVKELSEKFNAWSGLEWMDWAGKEQNEKKIITEQLNNGNEFTVFCRE